jgi:predicted phage terminase large subunit-like protein
MGIIDSLVNEDKKFKKEYLLARDNFWEYCKLRYPKHFKESRPYQKEICNTFQALYEKRIIRFLPDEAWRIVELTEGLSEYEVCRKMKLNVPPRHYKSFTATLFSQWVLGKNNENRIITVSYNEILSGRFGKAVRDGIDETRLDDKRVVFNDIFPETNIKQGDAATQMWALAGQFFNYLATSFNGTVTGVGCNIGIIDDQIKTAAEAHNENLLNNHWSWYTDTFLSRLEEDAMQIVIMTRWTSKDICGRLEKEAEASDWYELKLKACINETTGEMLCPEVFSFKSYTSKKALMSAAIFLANYQQEPMDVQGRLYTEFKTYEDLPRDEKGNLIFSGIISYTDTADTGADYTCTPVALIYNGDAYLIDVSFSDQQMEFTEPETAKLLYINNVNTAWIESNNGGRGFARNVERILKLKYKTRKVIIKWFHQNLNKVSRILSNATYVMEHVYFPINWHIKWPKFYEALITYQAKGKNKHDCAPDALTGLAEKMENKTRKKVRACKSLY